MTGHESADLIVSRNNGTIAIRSSKNGRLALLAQFVWCSWQDRCSFANLDSYYYNKGLMLVKEIRKDGDYLVFTFVKREETVWVFGDWKFGDNDVDEIRAQVMHGTYQDGNDFLKMCRELGLTMEDGGYVPFSNGHLDERLDGSGRKYLGYSDYDLAMRKESNPPTKEELAKILDMHFN